MRKERQNRPLFTKALGCCLGLAGALAANCDEAQAGHWEEVLYSDPNIGVTQQHIKDCVDGRFIVRGHTSWWHGDLSNYDVPWYGRDALDHAPLVMNHEGKAASLESTGRVRSLFHWVRDDSWDDPPKFLFLTVSGDTYVKACSDIGSASNPQMRGETADASANGATGTAHDTQIQGSTWRTNEASKMTSVCVATGDQELVYGPWVSVSGRGSIPGGRVIVRNTPEYNYEEPLTG